MAMTWSSIEQGSAYVSRYSKSRKLTISDGNAFFRVLLISGLDLLCEKVTDVRRFMLSIHVYLFRLIIGM